MISIKDEWTKVIHDWPEPKSIQHIEVFFAFANFYWRFIQSFKWIAALLSLILRITRVDLLTIILICIIVNNIIDRVDGNTKVVRAKVSAKTN